MTPGPVLRELKLVEPESEDGDSAQSLQIAFASSDTHRIDQHFGSATGFTIYAVTSDEAHLTRVVSFEAAEMDGNEAKLVDRIALLDGCAAIYCCAVGASAIAQLLSIQVQPLKMPPGTQIRTVIAELQDALSSEPLPWMRKALSGDKPLSRFDEMDDEGWVE